MKKFFFTIIFLCTSIHYANASLISLLHNPPEGLSGFRLLENLKNDVVPVIFCSNENQFLLLQLSKNKFLSEGQIFERKENWIVYPLCNISISFEQNDFILKMISDDFDLFTPKEVQIQKYKKEFEDMKKKVFQRPTYEHESYESFFNKDQLNASMLVTAFQICNQMVGNSYEQENFRAFIKNMAQSYFKNLYETIEYNPLFSSLVFVAERNQLLRVIPRNMSETEILFDINQFFIQTTGHIKNKERQDAPFCIQCSYKLNHEDQANWYALLQDYPEEPGDVLALKWLPENQHSERTMRVNSVIGGNQLKIIFTSLLTNALKNFSCVLNLPS